MNIKREKHLCKGDEKADGQMQGGLLEKSVSAGCRSLRRHKGLRKNVTQSLLHPEERSSSREAMSFL